MKLLSVMVVAPVLRRLATVHAVPVGSPWLTSCPRCAASLGPLWPTGRCAACRGRVGPPPFVAEALVLGLVVPWFAVGLPVAYLWWALLAVPLVLVDLAVHRLPDRLTYPAFGGVVLLLAIGADWTAWWRALLAAFVVGGLFAVSTFVLGRRGFGLGDAKLALGCAALLGWFGWPVVVLGLMLAFAASGLLSLLLLAARKVRWSSHLPFGPFLVLGTLVAVLVH